MKNGHGSTAVGELSEAIQMKLLAGLYSQPVALAIGGLVPPGLAVVCFLRTSSRVYLWFFAAFLLVGLGRLALNVAFGRTPAAARSGRIWRRRFLIGCWVAALMNGTATALVLHVPDPFIQMIIVSTSTSIIMGFAARNAVFPKSVYAYVFVSETPPFISSLFSDDHFYLSYTPLIVFFVLSSCAVARYQYEQFVRFLLAEERNATLVEAVNRSNGELAQANAQLEVLASEKDLALAEQQRYFRTVVANAPVILIALDPAGTIVVAEGRDLHRLGFAATAMVGRSFEQLYVDVPELVAQARRALRGEAHAADAAVGDIVLETRWTPRFGADGALASVIAVATDITERRAAEHALRHRSLHDPLTRLPNRTALNERLGTLTSGSNNERLALVFIDLDRFREINDTLGHDVGDALLKSVAQRIERRLAQGSVINGVMRLGGDEFALLLPAHDERQASDVVRGVLADFAAAHTLGEYRVNVGASIGLALFPDHANDAQALQRCADVAMYAAKAAGSGLAVYNPAQDKHSAALLALEADMREAIQSGGFELHFQPQVDMLTGRIGSVEALVRWQHPVRGRIMPDEFIPLAERTGAIVALTHWVLAEALRQVAAWAAEGIELCVAVNISMRGLREAALPETIARLLELHNVPVSRLVIEVTESVIVADDDDTLAIFAQLAEMGVMLSIDDFGTGYSSLAYLRDLPVAELKIDKSFILALRENDTKAAELVRLIVNLGHNLGLRVVAEGIETEEIFEFLARWGCNIAQGFYVSRPMPADALRRLLTTSWPTAADRALSA